MLITPFNSKGAKTETDNDSFRFESISNIIVVVVRLQSRILVFISAGYLLCCVGNFKTNFKSDFYHVFEGIIIISKQKQKPVN